MTSDSQPAAVLPTPLPGDSRRSQPSAGRWPALLALCVGVMLAFVNISSTISALTAIQRALHTTPSTLVWITSAYSLVVVSLVMSAGTLGDLVGRRRVFAGGATVFAAASAMAYFSHSVGLLIAAQALMGVGGACVLPTSLAIVSHTFTDPHERTGAISIWAGCSGLGLAIGPIASGLILRDSTWQSVYLTNVALGVAALVLTLLLVPESSHPSRHLDPRGMVSCTLALAAGAYALIEGASAGYLSAPIVTAYVVLVVALVTFVRVELRHHDPMLDLRLFASRSFSTVMAVVTTALFGFVGIALLAVLYVERVQRLSALGTGLRILVMLGSYVVVSVVAARLVRRVGFVVLLTAGLVVMGLGALALLATGPTTGFDRLCLGLLAAGVGSGLIIAPSTAAAVNSVPAHQAGMASAAVNMFRQLGSVLGPAVLGTIVTSRFPADLDTRLAASGLPAPVRERVVHGATHGGDPATLPMSVAHVAIPALGRAFTNSVHLGLLVCGLVLLVMAVPTAAFVRHRADSR